MSRHEPIGSNVPVRDPVSGESGEEREKNDAGEDEADDDRNDDVERIVLE